MRAITAGLEFGRYVIRGKLGAGGMAEVFLADDTQLGRRVALKFLPPETEADPLAQRRLLREARAAATLDHPHICAVYEVGETDGRSFIAMQYVEGETLDARLRRSPLELPEILAIAVQIVDALSEAHAHGILHRDIKPGNIMVTPRGVAKVMDFGLAKHDPASAVVVGARREPCRPSAVRATSSARRRTCRPSRRAASCSIRAAISSASACCCTKW